ncbi:signal peptidase I [Sphaerisporangium fuscum]|uniref:signal peptidase I n=1 Tax=Sphaerisporangium fuscum TaxID=2835868 RepID=UPI001BDDA2F9|nr:signal peptidase I [Sphaerisporangium fuscum]
MSVEHEKPESGEPGDRQPSATEEGPSSGPAGGAAGADTVEPVAGGPSSSGADTGEAAAGGSRSAGEPASADGDAAKGKKSGWRESVLLVLSGVAVAVLVRLFVLDSFYIPSESMENTLLINDKVIVNRLSGDVDRGEIVVFKGWDGATTIKRVIGVGGDQVKCCDAKGRITVNGVPLDEQAYLNPQDFPSQEKFDITVPKGRLWLMGDHRAASEDSRAFMNDKFHGTISTDDVIGRAFALYWPPSRMTTFPVPETFSKVR